MLPIEIIEKLLADQVRFLDIMLQETRKQNALMKNTLDSSYAKLIGLGTPYEECIHSLRKVRKDFNTYLSIIRNTMIREEKSSSKRHQKKKRPPQNPS